eukprot:3328005-Rhodomonas_salina.2
MIHPALNDARRDSSLNPDAAQERVLIKPAAAADDACTDPDPDNTGVDSPIPHSHRDADTQTRRHADSMREFEGGAVRLRRSHQVRGEGEGGGDRPGRDGVLVLPILRITNTPKCNTINTKQP